MRCKSNHWWDTAVQSFVMLHIIRTLMEEQEPDQEDEFISLPDLDELADPLM